MLCYLNGFVYRLSFCSQGQHLDISMDNADMVYMDIMICWNIIMVISTSLRPLVDGTNLCNVLFFIGAIDFNDVIYIY
jgi:hypothetical protein